MPSGFDLTIGFGVAGNSLGYLGGGWARAEETFTWSVGQESHLLLPLGGEAREYILTLRVVPFTMSGVLRTQRLTVTVDETTIGTATLSRPAVMAWRIPMGLVRRPDRTLVTLLHPDATKPSDISANGDDRELAFSVSTARIQAVSPAMFAGHRLPAGLRLGGGTIGPAFATHPAVDLKEWVMERTGLTLPELAIRFESLGDNCEFGLFQRRCDTEPLGLLRFSGSFSNDIARGIELDFDGIGEPADISVRLEGENGQREFMVYEGKYGLVYHTFVFEGERMPDLMIRQEATRLKFLRRKFLEELEAGQKIFVFKSGVPVQEAEVLALSMALNRKAPNTLLWVVPEEPGKPSGTVEVAMNGLLKAYIDRFAPVDDARDVSFDSWVRICVNAFLLHRMTRENA